MSPDKPISVAYLFTTFPVLTETFYQREVRAMRAAGAELRVYSLWGGDASFEGLPVQRFAKWRLATLPWWLAYWIARRPGAAWQTVCDLLGARPRSWLNLGENLLGLGFALVHAREVERDRPEILHAAWASMPAAAALLLGRLTGTPFSMGAHAYDVFEHGGDWLLPAKLAAAGLVVTSTVHALEELLRRGADSARTALIRRGLDRLPTLAAPRSPRRALRLLSVGRLVEKKGYREQIRVYAAARAAGLDIEARIVGDGPLRGRIERDIAEGGLTGCVQLTGALRHDAVRGQYEWADLLLFTGRVARNGDRDGLPNVIPEAMAFGVPVVASPVGGVPEAITDGENGLLVAADDTGAWVDALRRLGDDDALYRRLRDAGRAWVESRFDAGRNAARLHERFRQLAREREGAPAAEPVAAR